MELRTSERDGALRSDDRPSIAVLPFANLGRDADERYLSDGITEDIITELSRFREILVIGRGSSFACEPFAADTRRVARELGVRYVLEGSIRRAANRLRITGQLIDPRAGEQIWGDRHDGTLDDILDLQAEISARIVGSIVPEIQDAEQRRAENLPLSDVAAYELALKAGALIARGSALSDAALLTEGIRLARESVERDPLCRRAHYAIAWGHCRRGALDVFGARAQQDFVAANDAAQALHALDQRNHAAYAVLGHIAMRRLRHDEALASLRQAHLLNPNDVTTLRWLSWEESNFGLAEEAWEHAALSVRLSPRGRLLDASHWCLALAAYVAEDLPRCIEHARQAIALNPRFAGHHVLLAAGLAEAGATDEARATAAEVMRAAPGLLQARLAGKTYFAVGSLAERYLKALRRATGQEAGPLPSRPARNAAPLTGREREVLRHVASGLSNAEIAALLGLSEHTVKRHVANILTRLALPTRAAAVASAARLGLI